MKVLEYITVCIIILVIIPVILELDCFLLGLSSEELDFLILYCFPEFCKPSESKRLMVLNVAMCSV